MTTVGTSVVKREKPKSDTAVQNPVKRRDLTKSLQEPNPKNPCHGIWRWKPLIGDTQALSSHKPAKDLASAASQASASHERRSQTPNESFSPSCSFGRPPDFRQSTHAERDSHDVITMPHTTERIDRQEASPTKLVGIVMTRRPRRILVVLSDKGLQETLSQLQRLRLWVL